MTAEQSLARFVDRFTMVYDRHYPHEIELVWEAVSNAEHLDVWMLPESRVERRLGGACAFGWGSPADHPDASYGTITAFEPPRTIEYTFEDGESHMRFDLEPAEGGTLLHFTLRFMPPPEDAPDAEPWVGSDLPAGPGTPWRPGFVAGYHEFLDDLGAFLAGEWTADDRAAHLSGDAAHQQRHEEWVGRYREHIRDRCPEA